MIEELTKAIEVLLVEDSPSDVRLMVEILKARRGLVNLTVARDGEEALAILRGGGKGPSPRRPQLILLDLNLPKKDGCEVLADIKSDADLKRIPVIVLTSSRARQDVDMAYDLHANCYIAKPIDLDDYVKVVKAIEDFWLNLVMLPQDDDNDS